MKIVQPLNGREVLYPDKECQSRLVSIGGKNLFGWPNFRLVWGWSRLEPFYSRRTGNYDRRPRYFNQKNRWIIEAWHPPSMSREAWERETRGFEDGRPVNYLGPYPSQGDYEYLAHIEKADGGFLQVTPRMCEVILDMTKRSRGVSRYDRRDFLLGVEEKKHRDFDSDADAAINDAGRPFGGNYFVPVTGPSPDHWPKDKSLRFNPS